MVCRLSDNVLAGTRQVATPLPLTMTLEQRVVLVVVSTKFTVPVFTLLVLVVVEVNVTAWLVFDGFSEELIVVVVAAAAGVVVMSRDQPPATEDVPPPASSETYSVQVPLTLAPLNPPKTEAKVDVPCVGASLYGPAGAPEKLSGSED